MFELRGKRTSLLAHQTPLHGEHSRLNLYPGTLNHYISEGVETRSELSVLVDYGIDLYQGYYFAKPLFEGLPKVEVSCFELG